MLSIIIVNYNTTGLTKQCIKNIKANSNSLDYEIIVVDNGSKQNPEKELKEKYPYITYISLPKNKGMGTGNNAGIKRARGEYVLILNPDVAVTPGSIESLLAHIKQNEKIGCVAPQLTYPNKQYQQSRYRFPKNYFLPIFIRTKIGKYGKKYLDEYLMNNVDKDSPHPIDWARGSAMIIRKKILDELQGFDENFFMYLEDTDLCKRIWQSGSEVWYVPSSVMIHYYGKFSGQDNWLLDLGKKYSWMHIISWTKYFIKWKKNSAAN